VSAQPVVVITHRVHPEAMELLGTKCAVIANDSLHSWPREKLNTLAAQADALMVFMSDSVDDGFLERCPRLKIIAAALKGHDNFDVAACTRRGVWFTVVPDLLSLPTAELALGLMLGITRNIAAGDRLVRSGSFQGWRPVLYGSGLHVRMIGIVGMGKLGRALASVLAGFDTEVLYSDPAPLTSEEESQLRVRRVEMNALLAQSDIVVTLLPLTESTFHLIDGGRNRARETRQLRGQCWTRLRRR
jgi:phosphonate dehydrogenase